MCTHVFMTLLVHLIQWSYVYILLEQLFHAGVRGKCWRLIWQWYCNPTSQVKLGNLLSKPFAISRGIHQGSILSPTLLNLVMDPLLSKLRARCLGLSINGLFLGVFAHADYIRTIASNLADAKPSKSSLFIPLLNPGASTSVQRSVLYFHPTKTSPI